LINLVINLFSKTQVPVGSTSHLQNPLLQTIRALASTFKIHINGHPDGKFSSSGRMLLTVERPDGNIASSGLLLRIRFLISILASFCVWTKSLKCKDVVNRDSTFSVMSVVSVCKSEEFQDPCQPSGQSSHPVRTTCHPVRTLDIPASSVRTKYSFRPDPIIYREVSVPACIRLDVSAARPDASQYSISF
jgi:hypothetical protein